MESLLSHSAFLGVYRCVMGISSVHPIACTSAVRGFLNQTMRVLCRVGGRFLDQAGGGLDFAFPFRNVSVIQRPA